MLLKIKAFILAIPSKVQAFLASASSPVAFIVGAVAAYIAHPILKLAIGAIRLLLKI